MAKRSGPDIHTARLTMALLSSKWGRRVSRGKWIAVCAAAAVVVAVTAAALVVPWSTWLRPHLPDIPSCTEIFASPTVENAVQEAFSTTWQRRQPDFGNGSGVSLCYVTAILPDVYGPQPEAGPRFRRLGVQVVRQSPRSFARTRGYCRENSHSYGFADESGLADDAFSCWHSNQSTVFLAYLDRRIRFQIGDLTFQVELHGTNYGPQSDAALQPLRAELVHHARCIAEAVAVEFGGSESVEPVCERKIPDL